MDYTLVAGTVASLVALGVVLWSIYQLQAERKAAEILTKENFALQQTVVQLTMALSEGLQRMAATNAETMKQLSVEAMNSLKAQSLEQKVRVESFDRQLRGLERLGGTKVPKREQTPQEKHAMFLQQLAREGTARSPDGTEFEAVG